MSTADAGTALDVLDKLVADAEGFRAQIDSPFETAVDQLHEDLGRWAGYAERQIRNYVSDSEAAAASERISFYLDLYGNYQHDEEIKEAIEYLRGLRRAVEREPALARQPATLATDGLATEAVISTPQEPWPRAAERPEIEELVRLYYQWHWLVTIADRTRGTITSAIGFIAKFPWWTWQFARSGWIGATVTTLGSIASIVGAGIGIYVLLSSG